MPSTRPIGLHRRRSWQTGFGSSSQPYPDHYQPKPYSKSYVRHLDNWYAQSHPDEDFAETFAVWLKPRSKWRTQYEGWPAMKKLEFVDGLMTEICEERPRISSRERVDSVRTCARRCAPTTRRSGAPLRRGSELLLRPRAAATVLRRARTRQCNPSAAAFLRRNRRELRQVVAEWTGQYQYTIDQVLSEMIERCQELRLRLRQSEQVDQTRRSGDADRADHELPARRSSQSRLMRKLRER